MNPFGGASIQAKAPEKGSFPLDRAGQVGGREGGVEGGGREERGEWDNDSSAAERDGTEEYEGRRRELRSLLGAYVLTARM